MELPFIAHVLKSSRSCWTFLWSLRLGVVAWQYVTPHTYPFQNEIQSKRAMDEIQNGLGGRRYLFTATGLCGLKQGESPEDLLEILYDIHWVDKKHWRYLEISWDITTWCIQTTSTEMASFSHQKLIEIAFVPSLADDGWALRMSDRSIPEIPFNTHVISMFHSEKLELPLQWLDQSL